MDVARYAVTNTTLQQVGSVGAVKLREARAVGIIFATLTSGQVAKLRLLGCTVSKVERVKPSVMPPAPAKGVPLYTAGDLAYAMGVEEIRTMTTPPLSGAGLNLAILDTGIRETHELVRGRVVYRENYTSSPMRDGFDHGTGVCGIAVTIAPLCNILNLKVLGEDGEGTEEEVVMGIDDMVSMHDEGGEYAPSVINLSLGTPDKGDPSSPMRVACRAAVERGILVFAAAGNMGPEESTLLGPACEEYVVAVGSAKFEPFQVSDFSSRGPSREGLVKPDALMFGEDIIMAGSSSDTATVAKSGTSFSVPFASSAGILYNEGLSYWLAGHPEFVLPGIAVEFLTTQQLIENYLPEVCVKPEGVAPGKDNSHGYGLPFAPLVLEKLGFRAALGVSSLLVGFVAVIMMVGMMKAVK